MTFWTDRPEVSGDMLTNKNGTHLKTSALSDCWDGKRKRKKERKKERKKDRNGVIYRHSINRLWDLTFIL